MSRGCVWWKKGMNNLMNTWQEVQAKERRKETKRRKKKDSDEETILR